MFSPTAWLGISLNCMRRLGLSFVPSQRIPEAVNHDMINIFALALEKNNMIVAQRNDYEVFVNVYFIEFYVI